MPISPLTEGSPCTSQGLFGKVLRKLSLKRKSSRSSLQGKRKNSQSPLDGCNLDGYNLEGFFAEVGHNVARMDTHTFFNVEVSPSLLVIDPL